MTTKVWVFNTLIALAVLVPGWSTAQEAAGERRIPMPQPFEVPEFFKQGPETSAIEGDPAQEEVIRVGAEVDGFEVDARQDAELERLERLEQLEQRMNELQRTGVAPKGLGDIELDLKTRTLKYGDPVVVTCAPGMTCTVQLGRGERIMHTAVVSKSWGYSEGEFGRGADRYQTVSVSPSTWGLTTNQNIFTNQRVYQIVYQSPERPERGRLVVSSMTLFTYPTVPKLVEREPPPICRQLGETETKASEPKLEIALEYRLEEPRHRCRRFRWAKEMRVYDDGESVEVRLPEAAFKGGEMPLIAALDVEGEEMVANAEVVERREGRGWRVPFVAAGVEIRRGKRWVRAWKKE